MPQKKQYIKVVITRHDGTKFNNPLKLNEITLLTKILKEHRSATSHIVEVDADIYNLIFNI